MNEFEPNNLANLFMLSNIYKDLRRLEDVARLNIAMRDIMFKKLSRFSVIGCNDSVVELYSLDERHPEIESIYQSLKGLTTLLRLNGYVLNLVDVAHGNWTRRELSWGYSNLYELWLSIWKTHSPLQTNINSSSSLSFSSCCCFLSNSVTIKFLVFIWAIWQWLLLYVVTSSICLFLGWKGIFVFTCNLLHSNGDCLPVIVILRRPK